MKYAFHPQARDELNQAVDFYEARQAILGVEFLEEVYSTIQRIIEFPINNRSIHGNVLLIDSLSASFIKSKETRYLLWQLLIYRVNLDIGRKDCLEGVERFYTLVIHDLDFVKRIVLAAKFPEPEPEQNAFASWLLAELASEQRWAKAFEASQDQFSQLAEEALAGHRVGKIV